MLPSTKTLVILQLISQYATFAKGHLSNGPSGSVQPRRQWAAATATTSLTKPFAWGVLPHHCRALEVRGGTSKPPSSDEEEVIDEEEEDDEEEDEDDGEEDQVEFSNQTIDPDADIKVPDDDEEESLEESQADIEVMVEMEAEESEESNIVNQEPDAAVAQPIEPEAMEATLMAETAPSVDDGDSSAFVDRMELADAYDEGESTTFDNDANIADTLTAQVANDAGNAPQPSVESETREQVDPEPEATQPEPSAVVEAEESTEKPISEPASEQDVVADNEPDAEPQPEPAKVADTSQGKAAVAPASETITGAMEESLRKLGYSRDDISRMKPSVAAVAIDKKLSRPVEGLPDNWFLPGKKPRYNSKLAKIIAKVLLPILAAAVAIKGGMEVDLLSMFSSTKQSDGSSSESFRPMTASDMAYYSGIVTEATRKGSVSAKR